MPIDARAQALFRAAINNNKDEILKLNPSQEELNLFNTTLRMPLIYMAATSNSFAIIELLFNQGVDLLAHTDKFLLIDSLQHISDKNIINLFLTKLEAIINTWSLKESDLISTQQLNVLIGYLCLLNADTESKNSEKINRIKQLINPLASKNFEHDFQRAYLLQIHSGYTKIPPTKELSDFFAALPDRAKNANEEYFLAKIKIIAIKDKIQLAKSKPNNELVSSYKEIELVYLNILSEINDNFPILKLEITKALVVINSVTKSYLESIKLLNTLVDLYQKLDDFCKITPLKTHETKIFSELIETLYSLYNLEPDVEKRLTANLSPLIESFKKLDTTLTGIAKDSSVNSPITLTFFSHYVLFNVDTKNQLKSYIAKAFTALAQKFVTLIDNVEITADTPPQIFNIKYLELLKKERDYIFLLTKADRAIFKRELINYLLKAVSFYILFAERKYTGFLNGLFISYSRLIQAINNNIKLSNNIAFDAKLVANCSDFGNTTEAFLDHILQTALVVSNQDIIFTCTAPLDEDIEGSYSYSYQAETVENSFIVKAEDAFSYIHSCTFLLNDYSFGNLSVYDKETMLILFEECQDALNHAIRSTQIKASTLISTSSSSKSAQKIKHKQKDLTGLYFNNLNNQSFWHISSLYLILLSLNEEIPNNFLTRQTPLFIDNLVTFYKHPLTKNDSDKYFQKISLPLSSENISKLRSVQLTEKKHNISLLELMIRHINILVSFSKTESNALDLNQANFKHDLEVLSNLAGVRLKKLAPELPASNPEQKYTDALKINNFVYAELKIDHTNLSISFEEEDSLAVFISALKKYSLAYSLKNKTVTTKELNNKLLGKVAAAINDTLELKVTPLPEQQFFHSKVTTFKKENNVIFKLADENAYQVLQTILNLFELHYKATELTITILDYFTLTDEQLLTFREKLYTTLNPGKIYKPAQTKNQQETKNNSIKEKTRLNPHEEKEAKFLFQHGFFKLFGSKLIKTNLNPWPVPKVKHDFLSDIIQEEETVNDGEEAVIEIQEIRKQNIEFLLFDENEPKELNLPKSNEWSSLLPISLLSGLPKLLNNDNKDKFDALLKHTNAFLQEYQRRNTKVTFYHAARAAVLLSQIEYENQTSLFLGKEGSWKHIFNFKNILAHRADLFLTKPIYMKYIVEIYKEFLLPYLKFIYENNQGPVLALVIFENHPLYKNFSYQHQAITELHLVKPHTLIGYPDKLLKTCLNQFKSFINNSEITDIIYLGDLLKSFSNEKTRKCKETFGSQLNVAHYSKNLTMLFNVDPEVGILSTLLSDSEKLKEFVEIFSFKDFLILAIEIRNSFFHSSDFAEKHQEIMSLLKQLPLQFLEQEFYEKISELTIDVKENLSSKATYSM